MHARPSTRESAFALKKILADFVQRGMLRRCTSCSCERSWLTTKQSCCKTTRCALKRLLQQLPHAIASRIGRHTVWHTCKAFITASFR